MGTETAKDQLGLVDQRGDYVQGNIEPNLIGGSGSGREKSDFQAAKITDPSGGPGEIVNPVYEWDDSRAI